MQPTPEEVAARIRQLMDEQGQTVSGLARELAEQPDSSAKEATWRGLLNAWRNPDTRRTPGPATAPLLARLLGVQPEELMASEPRTSLRALGKQLAELRATVQAIDEREAHLANELERLIAEQTRQSDLLAKLVEEMTRAREA